MAGIYLHIPFCKRRCIYCGFYSSTLSELKESYVEALCREIADRKDYLDGEPVRTIYLGGGTPSQLSIKELKQIFERLSVTFDLSQVKEVTLEANPDDLTAPYVEGLATLPVNRLSMGVQSFDDKMLQLLNRRHTANQAREAVRRCREAGFRNLSIDLIYGLPGEREVDLAHDLEEALALGVEHLSAYHLMIEEGTPLHRLWQTHQVEEADEELSLRLYELLTQRLRSAGYHHYEISNFALPGYESKHNSGYWDGTPYLGCGAAAHSYNRLSREWNIASVEEYIHDRRSEREELDEQTRYNERVMMALRTSQGIDLEALRQTFGEEYYAYALKQAQPFLQAGQMEKCSGRLRFTHQGVMISDEIMAELFMV